MTSEPLEVLKKGLSSLKRQIAAKKDHLTTCLKNKQPISKEDETWLDKGARNTVDEDWVVDLLEDEQNYMMVELSNQDICNAVLKATNGKQGHKS